MQPHEGKGKIELFGPGKTKKSACSYKGDNKQDGKDTSQGNPLGPGSLIIVTCIGSTIFSHKYTQDAENPAYSFGTSYLFIYYA